MSHADLVEAACRWLRGTARCRPVLSGIASAGEIPDAIGWSSSWKHRGSIVVECKTSVADFGRDKHKYAVWRHVWKRAMDGKISYCQCGHHKTSHYYHSMPDKRGACRQDCPCVEFTSTEGSLNSSGDLITPFQAVREVKVTKEAAAIYTASGFSAMLQAQAVGFKNDLVRLGYDVGDVTMQSEMEIATNSKTVTFVAELF